MKWLREKLGIKQKFPISAGQIWLDNDWDDTQVQVVKVNAKGTQVRYKYVMIKGASISDNDHKEMSIGSFMAFFEPKKKTSFCEDNARVARID